VKPQLSQPFMKAAKKKLGPSLMYELLQSQIEVATTPADCSRDARQQLQYFRGSLADLGRDFELGIVAAGTHPLAMPHKQQMTPKRRYAKVAKDLGMVAWGNPLCGLHVHVEVPEPDQRVAIMHRLMPFVPLLLALSTSSPFWAGCNTGLMGYRNAANDAFPRTGFPEMFQSLTEYEAYIGALVDAKIIGDSTYISGGRCGLRCGIQRSSCGSPTAARRLMMPSPSRRSIGLWCAMWCASRGSIQASVLWLGR